MQCSSGSSCVDDRSTFDKDYIPSSGGSTMDFDLGYSDMEDNLEDIDDGEDRHLLLAAELVDHGHAVQVDVIRITWKGN